MANPSRARVTFAALMLVILLAALDATILAAAVPTIAAELDGIDQIAWITTAFMLAQIACAPVYGKLGDVYGRKPVLQSAVGVFLVGSLLCGLARSMPELAAARFVQGAGAGGLMVLVQATVGDLVPPRERAKYQTLFGAVFGVASVAGPLLGGALVEQLSWRWVFLVNLPLGLVALGVLAVVMPTSAVRRVREIDYAGAALLAGALTSVCLLATLGSLGWGLAAAGLAAAFVVVERRAADPILPAALVREPVFRIAGALSAVLGCVMFSVVTFTPLYFQVVKGDAPTTSGLRLVAMMAGIIAGGFVAGQVISRTGRYRVFPIAGFSLMAVGLAALATVTVGTDSLVVCAWLAIFGLGLGFTMQILVTVVQNAVPHAIIGTATSAVTVIRGMGTALGPAVLGAVFTAHLDGGYVHALRPVYAIGAVLAVVGVILALRLEERSLGRTVAVAT